MDRREQLLREALSLFSTKSGRDASMRELSRRVGIDVRTAYYYFPSKAQLLRELVAQGGHLDPPPTGTLDALRSMDEQAALHVIIRLVLDILTERAPYNRLLNAQVLAGDVDARVVAQELWDGWQAQLEALLQAAGVAQGEDVVEYARMLRSLLWGVFSESHLTGALDDDDTRDARARELAATLTRSGTFVPR